MKLLLRYGAQLKPEAAMLLGNESFFNTYLENGGDPNSLDGEESLLGMAAYYGKIEIARLFLEAGANVNIGHQRMGFTPLHYAARGNVELVQLLLEWGADIERADDCRSRPLHFAADTGAVDVIELLLDRGADIEADSNGGTPLLCAAQKGQAEAIALLMDRGATCDPRKFLDGTPLEAAVKKKHLKTVEVLLQKGAGCWNASSLASAIRWARDPAIRELLERYKTGLN